MNKAQERAIGLVAQQRAAAEHQRGIREGIAAERVRCGQLFDWWIEVGQYDTDFVPGDLAAAIENGTTLDELLEP